MEDLSQIAPWVVIVVIAAFVLLIAWAVPVRLWVAAIAARVPVGLLSLIGMRLRRVNPRAIVEPLIMAHKAGLHLTTDMLEAHYLAGGHVALVVQALISADKAKIPLTWERATAIDLAGRDVLEAVMMSVKPVVIDAPDPTKGTATVAAVAKDGIQLKAKARVTVRANIERLVGGAWTETIIARVGEGIVTTIGSADSHKSVLENPDMISKRVLEKGLDAGTAFEILSIDIADVDVGENIGAQLQIKQAEADKQIAIARAERKAAEARAVEQENLAEVQAMRAKVVEAEAEIPRAISEAFRTGRLGIMDYYQLRNIQADTQMRKTIAGESDSGQQPKGVT
ncbi:hypothetical protein AMJ85_04030 [candidate division BRC1 bacterium SM23_51]|nr:MAG: hypothetical protein AMJ85_04030 [candidate division BRC1 bacterium SM23_51]